MLHPPQMWGRGITIVLIGSMDGSGTHAESRVIAIAGFIGQEQEMADLHSNWDTILDDPKFRSRLSEFHMYDCVHLEEEFFRERWTFAERLMLYGMLCDLLSSSTVRPIGASVITECFTQIPEEDLDLLKDEKVQLGTPLDIVSI